MEKVLNETIKVGEINALEVIRDSDYGYFLESEDGKEVLLPNIYVMEDEMPFGSIIEVFIYTDSEDRPVASTKLPYAKLGEFGYFTVVDYKSYGAFVNWGLPKDLFVPLSQQKQHFTIGKKYLLRVCLDTQTNRLYATQKIGTYLNRELKGIYPNDIFSGIVLAETPLGYKVIADNQYEGMIFSNEIFAEVKVGDKVKVYVKKAREDGKFDFSLSPIGKKAKLSESEGVIIQLLKESGGEMSFTYKSDAEEIKKVFKMSKKVFKATLTKLIDAEQILLEPTSIKLL